MAQSLSVCFNKYLKHRLAASSEFASVAGSMPNITVAGDAVGRFSDVRPVDLADKSLVAAHTTLLHHVRIETSDRDRLVEVPQRECNAVVKTVDTLDDPFVGKFVRRVTVVTGGHAGMAGMPPCIELIAHDVAVHARLRVIGKVGVASGVAEGEQPQPESRAKQADHEQPGQMNPEVETSYSAAHRPFPLCAGLWIPSCATTSI
ncbi:hypothetical protein QPK87_12345 [Kamptonema cortianum]|nr:hypothetical protein [Kamptonema cortianum]